MQELIADIAVDVDAARLLTWRVADLVDRGQPFATESSRPSSSRPRPPCAPPTTPSRSSAVTATSTSTRSASCLRDARVMTLYEGTSQIQKLIIGRALTGESAFT